MYSVGSFRSPTCRPKRSSLLYARIESSSMSRTPYPSASACRSSAFAGCSGSGVFWISRSSITSAPPPLQTMISAGDGDGRQRTFVPQPLYGRHTGHPARPQTLSAKSWRCLPPCSKDAGRRVRLHPQTAAAHLHLRRESPAEESCLHGEFTLAPGLSGARCRRLPCPVWSEWTSAYPKYSIRFRHHFSGPC